MSLKENFYKLCLKYSNNTQLIDILWQEIKIHYTQAGRYYHNLHHLDTIYKSLKNIAILPQIEFSIFYHDIIYNVKSNKNEEDSAIVAKDRLLQLDVPQDTVDKTLEIILATKEHTSSNEDCKLFISADLYIFALERDEYFKELANIKKEYSSFKKVYNKKRIELLNLFLKRDKIFLHKNFYKYEDQARDNIKSEIEYLRINSEF